MPDTSVILLIVFLPLAGFVLLGLLGRKYMGKISGIVATLLIAATCCLAIYTAYQYFFEFGRVAGVYQKIIPFRYPWLSFANGLSIDMGALLDPISAMMLVVVSFVSLMVHIYSLGYMKGEERFPTYYAFLCLFTFSMLGLVLASNIFQIYFFWELVGVSSFLLIGFYYERPSAVAAAKKAFIVTRFADAGFLVGILILSYYSGTLDFETLVRKLTTPGSPELLSALGASFLGMSALTWGMALVFIGGAGKSAMFPFHIWLPDAMEGPTPVSALIHAATMVVAGVYLVARLFPVFSLSAPAVLHAIAYVGAFSALFAALIACTQTDIKRILAYSTISQIGYMMFALGVSGYGGAAGTGYTASMFHLFTHAMFKALLFLGAGSIIHYVHSNEMHDMGDLRKRLPVTHITFLIGCMALAGVPLLSGFFSKEEILAAAFERNPAVYWMGLVTSGLTAFYIFRLYFTVFWGRARDGGHHGQGEGSAVMLVPLLLLAAGAVLAGYIPFGRFVSSDGKDLQTPVNLQHAAAPVAVSLAGILIAAWLYLKQNDRPARITSALGALYRAAYRKFYIDEIYLFITKTIIFNLIGNLSQWLDKKVINGLVNFTGTATETLSGDIRKLQSGKLQQYALYFLGGVILLAVLFVYVWKGSYK